MVTKLVVVTSFMICTMGWAQDVGGSDVKIENNAEVTGTMQHLSAEIVRSSLVLEKKADAMRRSQQHRIIERCWNEGVGELIIEDLSAEEVRVIKRKENGQLLERSIIPNDSREQGIVSTSPGGESTWLGGWGTGGCTGGQSWWYRYILKPYESIVWVLNAEYETADYDLILWDYPNHSTILAAAWATTYPDTLYYTNNSSANAYVFLEVDYYSGNQNDIFYIKNVRRPTVSSNPQILSNYALRGFPRNNPTDGIEGYHPFPQSEHSHWYRWLMPSWWADSIVYLRLTNVGGGFDYDLYVYDSDLDYITGAAGVFYPDITGPIDGSLYAGTILYIEVRVYDQSAAEYRVDFDDIESSGTITVITPNGGESWHVGNGYYVTWTSTGITGNVRIDVYESGDFYYNIASNTTNNGSFYWTIPSNFGSGNTFKIRISSVDQPAIYDVSDGNFTIVRDPRTITFAGLEWFVKDGFGNPGSNKWSNSVENVWIDAYGWLHLKIRHSYNNWYCSEISSTEITQYGMHRFYVIGRLDSLDQNVVFALFLYKDDITEIDIECTTWGGNYTKNLWYVVQPGNIAGNADSHAMQLTGTYTTHYANWQHDSIIFKSIHGHYPEPPDPSFLINEWPYRGSYIPMQWENLRIHMSVWLYESNPPTNNQEVEIIVQDIDVPITGIDEKNVNTVIPFGSCDRLFHNWPDPVRKVTCIEYFLDEDEHVELRVFDACGRSVDILVEGMKQQGDHIVNWDISNTPVGVLPNGVYFYRLTTDDFVDTKKMVIIR